MHHHYGIRIYIRGLIEFTGYWRNDRYYCCIEKNYVCASRHRITEEQIIQTCETWNKVGFRIFVMQSRDYHYFSYKQIIYYKNKY